MKKQIKNMAITLFIAFPLAFILIFFGFFPPRFDVVVYTNNIVGEGTCSSYLTDSSTSFSYLYKGNAYFGSELKTLRLFYLPYNVKNVGLFMYNIQEADIVSCDISVFGRTVSHLNKDGITHPFTVTTNVAVSSDEEPMVHLVNDKNEECLSISFPGNSLIPKYIWFAYGCFIFLIAVVLSFLLSALVERIPEIRLPFMGASTIMMTMIMGCFLCGSIPYVNYTYFLLNWLLLYAIALLINALTLPWIGSVLVSAFTLFWYIANYFVISFRSKPIMPADLKALNTAKEVMGSYNLTPNWKIFLAVIILLFYGGLIIHVFHERKKTVVDVSLKKRLLYRACSFLVGMALLLFGVHNPVFESLNTFQWDAKVLECFHREGIVLTYIHSIISAHVSKPEGYSREVVESYLKEYQDVQTEAPEGIQPTRIIMVMNEAFSDLRTVGLNSEVDVMPFVDSLHKNTIYGNLYVSVIGGGTCNTEFEALTGNTLAFLGSGAYPYTENVTRPMFSLASYFQKNGYLTEAFHPNEADNWNRNMVYPNLGFEKFHSIEDYPELKYLHGYVKDECDYHYMISEDKDHDDVPRFFFDVTIQNHGDYDHFIDVEEEETVKKYGSELITPARVYLSLIKVSNDAIQNLVETYENSDEPTMIVFFGDHQPYLGQQAIDDFYTDMHSQMDLFKSKFFIWTNYESNSFENIDISANYLPWLILEKGNFPLPPYIQMLHELYEKYPILSSKGVLSLKNAEMYESVADVLDDPLIQKYQNIQYAILFDEIDSAWFEP